MQQVEGRALTQANQPNVTNALRGKVAGVILRQSSGMPGASSQITIRGSRSFSGNSYTLLNLDQILAWFEAILVTHNERLYSAVRVAASCLLME